MLMHAQDPIMTGDGGLITFNGKYVLITDLEDGSTDSGLLTRADLTRLMTANHELAHALAAVSVDCHIQEMRITSRTGKTYRDGVFGSGNLGHVQAIHMHTPEDAFILLAGWAWESRYGIPSRAKPDYEAGKRKLTQAVTVKFYGDRWEEIQERAGAFVEQHKDFIAKYAIDLAKDIAQDNGKLGKKALAKVNQDLRRYLGAAISRRLN